MKIFVFSDVHGDKYALHALESNEDFLSADMRIFLGDFITFGPHSEEVVQWFKSRSDIICLLGNNDSYVVNGLTELERLEKSRAKLEHMDVVRQELSDDSVQYLQSLPKEYELHITGKSILFCHFNWETDTEVCDESKTPEDKVTTVQSFKGRDYDYIVYGHVHTPSTLYDDNKVLCGVGSFGVLYPSRYTVINTDDFSFVRHKAVYEKEKFIADLGAVNDEARQYFYSFIDEELSSADKYD